MSTIERTLRWDSAPGGVRHGEFVDVPEVGRYLVKRLGKSSRDYRAYLNGKGTSFMGKRENVKDMVQRAVNATALRKHPPTTAQAVEFVLDALGARAAPPWLQHVTHVEGSPLINLLAEGRVFEVIVR